MIKYLANKFDLEIIDIYKEQVTNVYKKWYYGIIISKFFRDILKMKTKSINTSFISKVIQKIASITSRVFEYSNIHEDKDGHTIAITLKKVKDV